MYTHKYAYKSHVDTTRFITARTRNERMNSTREHAACTTCVIDLLLFSSSSPTRTTIIVAHARTPPRNVRVFRHRYALSTFENTGTANTPRRLLGVGSQIKQLSDRRGTTISETTKHNTMKTSVLTTVSRSIIVIALRADTETTVFRNRAIIAFFADLQLCLQYVRPGARHIDL